MVNLIRFTFTPANTLADVSVWQRRSHLIFKTNHQPHPKLKIIHDNCRAVTDRESKVMDGTLGWKEWM